MRKDPNTKIQDPENIQASNTKRWHVVAGYFDVWNLVFLWCLDLGSWIFLHTV